MEEVEFDVFLDWIFFVYEFWVVVFVSFQISKLLVILEVDNDFKIDNVELKYDYKYY